MYSKTMAQAVNEEPVEFNDALVVAPESDGCSLTVAGFLEDGLEHLTPDNKGEAGLETPLPDSSGVEGCRGAGVNDAVTDVEDFPEKISLEEEEGQVCRMEEVENAVAVPSFSIMQAQCKSEEDDGYCSRSSLDSPVQTSQSDSEANDPEVFALREISVTTSQPSPTGAPGKIETHMEAGAKYPARLMSTVSVSAATSRGTMPAPAGISSSYTSSHSTAGPQKILIVNKTANVKYLIPTTGEVKSTGAPKMLSIPSINAVPPPSASPQLPNLVNLKILKPGLNKFCPGQITLLRVPDKDATGLSSATVSRPLAKQTASARTLPRTNSFIARAGSQSNVNWQVADDPAVTVEKEIGNHAIQQSFADGPFSLAYSVESGTTTTTSKHNITSTRLTADLPDVDEYGCLGDVECHSEATSSSSVVGQQSTCRLPPGGDTISTVSRKAATPSACLQTAEGSSAQIGRNHADKSQLPLDAEPADDVIAAAAAADQDYSITSMIDEMRNSHETVPCSSIAVIGSAGSLNRNGAQRLAVGYHQGRPPVEGIACHAIGKSQVVVAAAGRDSTGGISGPPRVDKFKKPFPMASFPLGAVRLQDQGSAGKASATASSAAPAAKSAAGESDSPQRILTGCLSSTSFVEEGGHAGSVAKLAINGQIGVTNKGGVYQLGSRSSQDVTVILLPQTSLQSTPRKMNPANEATCKQVVLRIGPSQVFKAISVNTDGLRTQALKSDEKPGKGVGGEGTRKESTPESLSKASSQLNLALNKTTNVMAVIDRTVAAAGSKDATSAARHHPSPDKEPLSLPKSSTSIGYFASLSLPSLQVTNPGSSTDSSQRLTGGKQLPSAPALSKSGATSATTTTQYKGQKTVVQTGSSVRGRSTDGSSRNRISRQGLNTIRKSCQSVGYLHPLIDHDYCEFSAFCADVQSSIISLTDSSIRPERRYVKKNRAARTKAMRVSQYMSENCSVDHRPKRKYCKRKQALEAETGKKHGALNGRVKASGKAVASPGKGAGGAGKDGVQSSTTSADDKDYVKIPGYYQDEYVYYATKRLPGRPRNRSDASSKASDVAVSKPPATTPAAGISMFDWYKEMAQTDKTSRFGSAEIADCSTPRGSYLEEPSAGKDCTPVDESDVADLVMDMLPSGDLVRPISDDMKFMSSAGIVDSLLSNPLDMLATSGGESNESSGDVGSTYLNLMAEEVRLMLSSMGEAELKLLESHLENEKITEEMHADGLDINSYLGDYASHDANMSQSSVSNLLDVDDINDGDLLSADIANMNIILNDLNATNRQQATHDNATVKLESGVIGSIFDKGANGCEDFMGGIHDIGLSFASDAQTSKSFERPDQFRAPSLVPCSNGAESNAPLTCDTSSPPELTTINMFWNDLPGLLMNGKEFVRLVDIHKQIMPAKDTGILKKRCHMMGLHITNCTELQRDFLIRYMNAAKSKSTVIIAKDAAIMLIGFYVNPKSRSKGADDFELDVLIPPTKLSKPSPPPPPPPHARHQWSVVSKLKQQAGFPSAGSHPSAGSLSAGSDVGVATTAALERHICRTTTIAHPAREGPSTSSVVNGNDLISEPGVDVKRSERLRHKHFSYADLIHGGIDDIDRRGGRPEGGGDRTLADEDRSTFFGTRTFSSSLSDSEAVELENLIREQKRRRLTLEEKLHLKVLRNCQKKSALVPSSKADVALKGTRRRLLKRAKRTRRLLAWKHNRKLPSSAGDLHTLEHCYAASPAQLTGSTSKHQNPPDHHRRKSSEHHVTRSSHADSFTSPTPVSVPPKVAVLATKSATVGVIHRDVTCRVNRRRRSQIGELVIQLYTSNDAACIRCSNCREMLGVQQFLKHMHWRRGSEKLVRVTIAQKLHLQSSSRTPDNLAAWDEFQKKRGRFEGTPHTETTSNFVRQRTRDVTTKATNTAEDATKTVHHPSTRHSVRVSKRKLLHPVERYVFANKNAPTDTPAVLPAPDAKRRRLTTDVVDDHRSSAVVGQQNVTVPTVAVPTHSKFSQRQKSNLPSASREKGRRRSIVPSDRLLRITPRRSQDSRLTGASTSD